ncbi:DUF6522 family protein [Paracoccus spongiarum]|uniref:DUF6522 family protein n=1 Tax=Paracoccus spongiarum TaxID=3064387 RepID=A0ABT9JGL8_9RHOB|nr:DUF6522 family protein [Paracoccus sp. 2205BS29-5]MDP5308953.1 DUF6522 family protein [Paracoccus sp. 2205BS29-5]
MSAISRKAGDFVIDAALLADAFGLTEAQLRAAMRDGTMTSRCETGTGTDAGRSRLIFHHGGRACRFVVDEAGTVLSRASYPIRAGRT